LAKSICGAETKLTKKLDWAVSRVPKHLRPYDLGGPSKFGQSGRLFANKPQESMHEARDRLLMMALQNQLDEEQALEEEKRSQPETHN